MRPAVPPRLASRHAMNLDAAHLTPSPRLNHHSSARDQSRHPRAGDDGATPFIENAYRWVFGRPHQPAASSLIDLHRDGVTQFDRDLRQLWRHSDTVAYSRNDPLASSANPA